MVSSGNTTVPSETDLPARVRREAPADVRTLVIAWSAHEPERVGELAFLDGPGPWVLGRSAGDIDQLHFSQQHGNASAITGSLAGQSLSRRQLVIERGADGLLAKNAGQAVLRVNGVETQSDVVEPGDVLELTGHYVLFVTTRPARVEPFDWPAFRFGEADPFGFVGESAAMWKLRAAVAFAAGSGAHVLVHGPSGVGKELCAAAIHALSPRARGPFIARNASTLPSGLIDPELFGHVRNYPNAGMPEREGLVGAADGGTLFLDEIGEIPPELQAHLLRLLDRGDYHRLGETQARRADVRLVCATNRDVAGLKFDLVPRLKVQIELPPLDARREDIPLLVRYLLRQQAKTNQLAEKFVRRDRRDEADVDASLIVGLLRHSFPTNIRELERILLDAMFAAGEPPLVLPPGFEPAGEAAATTGAAAVLAVLERHHWNVTRAGRELGVSRHAIARLMKRYGLRAP